MAFAGCERREDADVLVGKVLTGEAPVGDPDPDALWVHELVGSEVVEPDGTARGLVEAVQENPASDLLVLASGALVPLTFLVGRDDEGRLVVDVPAGLFELVEGEGPDVVTAPFRFDVFTILPTMVEAAAGESLLGRAQVNGVLDVRVHDLREHTTDVHRTVDDAPFGGGAGMVLRPEPIFASVEASSCPRPLLLLGPGGRRLDQAWARELADGGGVSLLCGRYEGVDDRVRTELCDGELSIGDYVLGGGEVAALVVLEAVGRLVPGVMGNAASAQEESFTDGLLEHPQFTRPADFRGLAVPDVLRSGDHAAVARWRRAAALARTVAERPDLIEARGGLDERRPGAAGVVRRLCRPFRRPTGAP